MRRLSRRGLAGGMLGGMVGGLGGGMGASSMPGWAAEPSAVPSILVLFAGSIEDGGFMQAGHRGLMRSAEAGAGQHVRLGWVAGIPPDRAKLESALRDLATQRPALVIGHGGQNNEAARTVAAEFPDVRFVVTQGNVTGPNLGSYVVQQEQSAFLAGALAAWSTRTGVIGHMSGIRVAPGLRGRAAYLHGAAFADPAVRVLTNFSGNQDDNALSRRVAEAMAVAGADIVFTMLNAGRQGVTDVCRARGIWQIGNVVDWVATQPDVFLGSAVADVGEAVFAAVQDVLGQAWQGGVVRSIGLERPDAVRLTAGAQVPAARVERLAALAEAVRSGRQEVPGAWSGPEFQVPA